MTELRRWLAGFAAALAFAFVAPVHAQDADGSADSAYGDDLSAAGFQPAEGTRAGDEVPGGLLMIAAYGVMGTLLMAYVVVLVRRQRAVGDELDTVRRRLAEMDDRLEDLERPGGS